MFKRILEEFLQNRLIYIDKEIEDVSIKVTEKRIRILSNKGLLYNLIFGSTKGNK